MDGFNYTDRNGAPFWKQRVTKMVDGQNKSYIKTARLGTGKGNTPGMRIYISTCK